MDSDSEEDPEEVTELEPELGCSADKPPIAQSNQQQSTEFEFILGLLYPQTITAAERSGWAQVRKGVCVI